jgi:S1-C subfamily serine protease
VVALTSGKAAVIGYVEGGARSVVPLWRIGARIRRAKGVTASQGQGQGYLGIGLRTVPTGVAIDEVQLESPAAIAGLRVGDVIVRHDEAPQLSKEMLTGVLRSDRPYTAHELVIVRGDRRLTVRVRVGERP